VDNVVSANLLACQAGGVSGVVFNVGTGERHTLNDLLRSVSTILGRDLSPEYVAPRPGDVRHSLADIGRARQRLGYEVKVRFEEGLRRTVAWFRESQQQS
jgi:UDP-N-acetylglucosamine 4-epimerase